MSVLRSRSDAAVASTVACALFALAGPIAAAPPVATMVADLGSEVPISLLDGYLAWRNGSVEWNGSAFFFNDDGAHGFELWRTDGTVAGTRLVLDICPGACGAHWFAAHQALAATSAAVYFTADDGVHGAELWRTDGTAAGTRMVQDIVPGAGASQPRAFAALGDTLLFWADDRIHGAELWRSDGTAEGTALVTELSPGPSGSFRGAGCVLGDALLFGAGSSLWRTDGSAAGTYPLAAVTVSSSIGFANPEFHCLAERAVFTGNDSGSVSGLALWASDGTPSGTLEIAALGFNWSGASSGSQVFFFEPEFSSSRLWQTDGTPDGTVVTSLPAGTAASPGTGLLAVAGDTLYFVARDESHGRELWKFGTGGFARVTDLAPGPADGIPYAPGEFSFGQWAFIAPLGSRVVFLGDDGIHGLEPWATDGTPGNAVLLGDLAPGLAASPSDYLVSLRPQMSLGATLLRRWRDAGGAVRLWRTDGTPAGSEPLATLNETTSAWLVPAPAASFYSPKLTCFSPLRAGLLFFAIGGALGSEPWFSDGTAAGTTLVADASPGPLWSDPVTCAPIADRAVLQLAAGVENDYELSLRATSGAPGSLETISENPTSVGWTETSCYFDERLVFPVDGMTATDASAAGTVALDATERPQRLVATAGSRLFGSDSGLSVLDEETGTTVDLFDPVTGGPDFPLRLTALGAGLLFFAWSPATGQELWLSDGTSEGTTLVADVRPGPASGILDRYIVYHPEIVTRLVALGPIALFAADDGVHGEELWRTDGTAAGTVMVRDLFPGVYPSSPRELTRVGDYVFFTAESADAGRELWMSNGFSGVTRRVADLVPGAGSSVPQELAAIRDELWFSAWTPELGREPWRLRRGAGHDVVAERLGDLAPGPLSSSPLIFKNAGADVFTVANDNLHGFELWKIRDPDLLFADDFESSGLALWAPAAP